MNFDAIYSLSTENHGIVTYSAAIGLGVKGKDLARWVKIGRMLKLGHGVYRTTQYPFSEDDQFANAVALVGPKAYLCGESVLAYLRLSPSVDVRTLRVAVPVRCRRRLPQSIKVEIRSPKYQPMNYNGVMIEKPFDAIRSCVGTMMSDQLYDAAEEAYRTGKLFKEDFEQLSMEIRRHA